MTSATGAIITYMLSATGRDYAMLKGAGVAITQWIGIWYDLRAGIVVEVFFEG